MYNMDSLAGVNLMLVFPVCVDDEDKIIYFCVSDGNTRAIIIIIIIIINGSAIKETFERPFNLGR